MIEGLWQRIDRNSDVIGHVLNDEVIIKINMIRHIESDAFFYFCPLYSSTADWCSQATAMN